MNASKNLRRTREGQEAPISPAFDQTKQIPIVGPVLQPAQGIEDSVDKHFQQTYEGGDRKGDPALIKILVSQSLDGLKWLESYGMKFNDKIGSVVGSLWPRTHQAIAGTGYISTLSAVAKKNGVKIYLDTKATELIEKDGRVVGVKALDKDKKPVMYLARRGVVMAEDSRRDVLTAAIFAQTNGGYYMVNDSSIVGECNEVGENIQNLVAQGKILKGDTIADFNGVVANGNDPFGRKVFKNPIFKGPFYAVLRAPAVHHTMGGIKIDEKAEAIGKDGKVIPGFYAAGEVTGGIHGTNRLGGNALVDTIVFGRIAGASAATATPAKY